MDLTGIDKKIASAYNYGTKSELKELRNQLVSYKMELDKFMSKYLTMFERKMSYDELDTPIWNLYHKKYDEYTKVTKSLNTAEYYINKK